MTRKTERKDVRFYVTPHDRELWELVNREGYKPADIREAAAYGLKHFGTVENLQHEADALRRENETLRLMIDVISKSTPAAAQIVQAVPMVQAAPAPAPQTEELKQKPETPRPTPAKEERAEQDTTTTARQAQTDMPKRRRVAELDPASAAAAARGDFLAGFMNMHK